MIGNFCRSCIDDGDKPDGAVSGGIWGFFTNLFRPEPKQKPLTPEEVRARLDDAIKKYGAAPPEKRGDIVGEFARLPREKPKH